MELIAGGVRPCGVEGTLFKTAQQPFKGHLWILPWLLFDGLYYQAHVLLFAKVERLQRSQGAFRVNRLDRLDHAAQYTRLG